MFLLLIDFALTRFTLPRSDPLKYRFHHAIAAHRVELVQVGGPSLGAGIEFFAQHGVGAVQAGVVRALCESRGRGGVVHRHLLLLSPRGARARALWWGRCIPVPDNIRLLR